jgi:predicted CoA-substrate-specific enzyme activase
MARFLGIDIGSVNTKVVITADEELAFFHLIPSGANYRTASQKAIDEVLKKAGLALGDITAMVATGCGAAGAEFIGQQTSDISCCARGVHRIFPGVRTVIDIGGQASKVLRVNNEGRATNFMVSERCAAGSGRFMQIIARVLQIDIKDAGALSLKSENPIIYTTSCAVFGESEAISRVAEGTPKEDILAGVQNAIAVKISNLIDRVGLEEECAMVGGGALDVGLVKRTMDRLGIPLRVPEQPQLMAAYGAALVARENGPS